MNSQPPLSIPLAPELYQRLKAHCGDDAAAIQAFVAQAVENELARRASEKETNATQPDSKAQEADLKDYLNKGQSGSRSYGIKGQGW